MDKAGLQLETFSTTEACKGRLLKLYHSQYKKPTEALQWLQCLSCIRGIQLMFPGCPDGPESSLPVGQWKTLRVTTSLSKIRQERRRQLKRQWLTLTRRRCMYPVSAVLTAVSTRPSRPPIVWKKNSVGVRPEQKLFSTKPLAAGIFAEKLLF